MNIKVAILLGVGVASAALIYWYMVRSKIQKHYDSYSEAYVYLGSPYRPEQAWSRGEYSEECLQHPDYRMCTLTDGTSGVCGTSGMCLTNFESDVRQQWDEIKMPLCYEPIFREGCQRFCNCKDLKGDVLDH